MYRDLNIEASTDNNQIKRSFKIKKQDLNDLDLLDQVFNIIDIQYNALQLINPYKDKNILFNFLKNLGDDIEFTFISNKVKNIILIL